MIVAKSAKGKRRGATIVESAFILIILIAFLFGIFEYGRLVMDWNLLNNAAREGCRYALANNTNASLNANVQAVVSNYMAGRDAGFGNFTVTVSGTHNGISTAVNNLTPGDPITVSVSGSYRLLNIIPVVSLPTTLPLNSSVTMICEGGP